MERLIDFGGGIESAYVLEPMMDSRKELKTPVLFPVLPYCHAMRVAVRIYAIVPKAGNA